MRLEIENTATLVKAAKEEIEEITRRMIEDSERIEALENFIAGLRILSPDDAAEIPDEPVGKEPKGMNAIVAVLKDNVGQWLIVEDLDREYGKRGWLRDSPNRAGTIRVNLREVRRRYGRHIEESTDPKDRRVLRFRWMSEDPSAEEGIS